MIVRLISKDGREIKEIKKTQEIAVRNAKKGAFTEFRGTSP